MYCCMYSHHTAAITKLHKIIAMATRFGSVVMHLASFNIFGITIISLLHLWDIYHPNSDYIHFWPPYLWEIIGYQLPASRAA